MGTESYAMYRLVDWDWIQVYKQKMGDDFRVYVNEVYKKLLSMKAGEVFSIADKVRVENIDLFVKIVCMFIQEGNSDFVFSDDFKKVKRNEKATMETQRKGISERESGEDDN